MAENTDVQEEYMSMDDFFTGLCAAMACKGEREFSFRDNEFYEAVEHAYNNLVDEVNEEELALQFRVRCHPIHGDSLAVRDAITRATGRRLLRLHMPDYQEGTITMDEHRAERYLDILPGGAELYENAADDVLDYV